jgi:hypothetical protein
MSHKAGVMRDIALYRIASAHKKSGERLVVIGYFKLDGKQFTIATYFPALKYWLTMLRNLSVLFSFIYPTIYLSQKNLDELITGVRAYDSKKNKVEYDSKNYVELYRIARIWMRVYFNPFYPPKQYLLDNRLESVKAIAENLKKTKYPEGKSEIDKLYIKKLREANQQVYNQISILEKQNKVAKTLISTFRGISDNPSDVNIAKLQSHALRFKSTLAEMADWCEQRATTWSDFVDIVSAYEQKEEDKNLIKKHGISAILSGLLGSIWGIFSGNSPFLGFLYGVTVEFSLGLLGDLIFKPKWQSKMLLRKAKSYRKDIGRVERFLELYYLQPNKEFFRF